MAQAGVVGHLIAIRHGPGIATRRAQIGMIGMCGMGSAPSLADRRAVWDGSRGGRVSGLRQFPLVAASGTTLVFVAISASLVARGVTSRRVVYEKATSRSVSI
jgi:hypothetical protein